MSHFVSSVSTLIAAFLIAVFIIPSPASAADREQSRAPEFRGITVEDVTYLKKHLPELASPNPPQSSLDEAIRVLMKIGSYSSARVDLIDGRYIISGNQLRRVTEIAVIGNADIPEEEVLTTIGLKTGDFFDELTVNEATEKIKELYGKRGFFNTIVGFDLKDIPPSSVRVAINIKARAPCKIIGVTFESENNELNEKLKGVAKKYVEQNFTDETISSLDASLKDYLVGHRYINAQLLQKSASYNDAKTSASLSYELTDPYRYELLLSGQTTYTDGKIISELNLNQFTRGSHDVAVDVGQLIKNFYYHNGYSQVQVVANETFVDSLKVKQLHIKIDEGPLVRIDNIEVTGRISRPSKYYAKFISDHSSDTVSDNHFVREDLDNGYKNLTTELNNQGFLKAKILTSRYEYNKKKDAVKVIVDIDEGPLTYLSQIHFSGVSAFSEQQLRTQLSIHDQAPLRLSQLEESIAALKNFYHDRGFLEMVLLNDENVITYDDKGVKAYVEFKIHEGPQIFVKSIVLDGNTFTKDYVVLRTVNIDVGDLLTPQLIEESKKRLEKLGAFSKIDLHTVEANTNVSQRTLVISLAEANPGLFKIGAGASNKNNFTLRGFSGVSYNNIKGTARAMSVYGLLEQSLSYANLLEYELDVGYLEPFLFDTKWRGRAGVGYSSLLLDILQDQLQITGRETLAVERDLTSRVKFSWMVWGHDAISEYTVPKSGPKTYEQPQIDVGYVGPSFDIDNRDNPFLPTRGDYFHANYIYADPNIVSSPFINFWKADATYSHYTRLPIFHKWVWANSVRGGWEENISHNEAVRIGTKYIYPQSGIPISYAYFLGGTTTIRGYTGSFPDTIPSGSQLPITFNQQGVLAANQVLIPSQSDFILLKSELRIPLKDPFGMVLFVDGGRVDIGGYPFTDPFKWSVGVGVRVNTPVGPVAIDFGHKMNPDPGLSNYAYHVSIGTF